MRCHRRALKYISDLCQIAETPNFFFCHRWFPIWKVTALSVQKLCNTPDVRKIVLKIKSYPIYARRKGLEF